jgi:hypothetical protein
VKFARLILLPVAAIILLGGAQGVSARGYESVGIREAHHKVQVAERDVARAKARLSAARKVEQETRCYVNQYGVNVGRWIWLADDVGWPSSQWSQLMYVVHRESGGNPRACNSSSGASGLMQFLPAWWQGKWNPYNPRVNLRHGCLAWKVSGWQHWAL